MKHCLSLLILAGVSLASISLPAFAQLPKQLVLGAADWCPYTCDAQHNQNQPGIVQQYIAKILANKGVELKVKVLPWSRAVRDAENNRLDGLITVVPGEAQGLLLTTTPTMAYQDCFYTRPEDTWTYTNQSSFSNIRFGAVQGYGYGEPIDTYIQNSQDVTLLNGDTLIPRLHIMVKSSRLDVFISERRVYSSEIMKAGMQPEALREISCINENPLFIALSPDQEWSEELLSVLNEELNKEENILMLKAIEASFLNK